MALGPGTLKVLMEENSVGECLQGLSKEKQQRIENTQGRATARRHEHVSRRNKNRDCPQSSEGCRNRGSVGPQELWPQVQDQLQPHRVGVGGIDILTFCLPPSKLLSGFPIGQTLQKQEHRAAQGVTAHTGQSSRTNENQHHPPHAHSAPIHDSRAWLGWGKCARLQHREDTKSHQVPYCPGVGANLVPLLWS